MSVIGNCLSCALVEEFLKKIKDFFSEIFLSFLYHANEFPLP
jgi:hypothetical protein